jgi:hypothetical protein
MSARRWPPRQQKPGELEAVVKCWNERYPVGTEVKYFPIIGGRTYGFTKTTAQAWILSGHTAVTNVEGVAGCVALQACQPHRLPDGSTAPRF